MNERKSHKDLFKKLADNQKNNCQSWWHKKGQDLFYMPDYYDLAINRADKRKPKHT